MHEHPEPSSVRRILLPSGRTITMVRFREEEGAENGLHVCRRCDSELVQPVQWSEREAGQCELTLECPNCGWLEIGTHGPAQVEALEERLDQGLLDMLDDLRRLTLVNTNDEINRFVAALQADVILPEDF